MGTGGGSLNVYNVKWPLDKISALKTMSSGCAMNNWFFEHYTTVVSL